MEMLNMKLICAAKNCKYSSSNEDTTHIMFINFPNSDVSKIWAHHCGRTDLLIKSNEELHLNYYICSHHIEDRYYINKTNPTVIDQQAVPTLFEVVIEKNSRNIFGKNGRTEVTDNVVLSYCDIDVGIDQYRDVGISLSNICRICGEASLNNIEIFALRGIELKLKEKINIHLPIKVDVEDLMPQKLCMTCYNKLEATHSLALTSLKTDMRLKRLLNVNGEISYDDRYNAIAEECSLEMAEEICVNEGEDVASIELTSNKIEEISTVQEITRKASCMNNAKKQRQPKLSSIIQSHSVENIGIETTNNVIKRYPNNGTANTETEIQRMCCKDTFETQEIFRNHKILCNVEDTVEQKQNETDSNRKTKKPSNIREINFAFGARTCDVCQEYFETDIQFVEHKRTHCKFVQEKHFQESDKLNTNEEEMQNIHKHSSNKPIPLIEISKKCGHCDLVYSTKKELLNHIMECHERQILFKCVVCDRSFERWSSLDVHEATHRIDKPYLCDLCGKSFKHSNNLRGHKRIHLDESKKKRHVCEICGNAFRSRFHLGEHVNQHSGNKPYSCEKCAKTFYKRIQLRQHKLSHGLNKHVCPICGAAFNRKGNMNTHLKRHNNEDSRYACSVCTQRFKSMSDLKLHRKTHTEQDILDSIQKRCFDKTALLNHERIYNDERINVECNICGKKLASKNSLIYHKKSVHYSERSHVCQFCGESFVSKEACLIHERIHTGERPYTCNICNMEYKCSSNLNQHMKIHSGIKPYKCIYCDKSFTRKGALNVHKRIHTGEKPFGCEICNKTFSQKNDMIKHSKWHDTKSLHCEQCNEVFAKKKDILKHIALHEQYDPMVEEYVGIEQQVQSYNVDNPCPQFG